MGKLPPRFLEDIFTSDRFYEDEKIEFPLEDVPFELHSYILEKMFYPDFANFNSCNSFSSEVCNSISPSIRLPLDLNYIICADHILGENGSDIIEKCLPKNVNFSCSLFRIQPQYWDVMQHYNIEADCLDIFCEDYSETFLKELLKFTNATELMVREISLAMLELPEVKELDSIEFYCPDLTDEHFLKLRQPSIIAEDFEPSLGCFIKFINEWFKGEREIVETRLKWDEFLWTFRSKALKKVLPFTEEPLCPHEYGDFWICRSEDHNDCIKLSYEYEERLIIEGEEPCPKAKNDTDSDNE